MLQALGNAVSVQRNSFSASLTRVLWDLKRSYKDLALSSHPQREEREKRDSVVSGGAALCILCAVDPTSLASAVRQLHLGKLQVRNVLNKSKMVDLPAARAAGSFPSRARGSSAPPALPLSHSPPGKGWGALPAPLSEDLFQGLIN